MIRCGTGLLWQSRLSEGAYKLVGRCNIAIYIEKHCHVCYIPSAQFPSNFWRDRNGNYSRLTRG
jgi:hypothetical protein